MERFLDYFVPEKYELNIGVDKIKKKIGGIVVIRGEAKREKVKFHAVGLEVEQVLVNGEKVEFEVANGVLTLFKVPLGDVEVIVGYNGSLNENMEGAYLSTYDCRGETEVIVATQFESHYAREAFPCIDEPAAKAVFELSISLPKESDDIVLSNMPVKGKLEIHSFSGRGSSRPSSRGSDPLFLGSSLRTPSNEVFSSLPFDDYKTVSFEPTPRMSTYLLAWVIGKFHGKTVKNKYGVEITTYCSLAQDVDSVDFANEVAAKSLEFYNDNFGVPYPLTKCTQVALPDFEAGAMENWGLVTYRESMLLAGKNATIGTKKSVALTVAHELAHQWFGNLVTMMWWDDLWLNESFASVMEYYVVDAICPNYRIFETFFTNDAYAALVRDASKGVQSVHQEVNDPAEIATLFDGAIVYAKGARLMLMLIRLIGWEEFCKGMKDYFKKHEYGNTVGDDLWACLEPYAKFDVGKMMHAFIDKPGYPVVTLSKDGFSQKRFLLDGEFEEAEWPLPEIREDMSGHYVLNLSNDEFDERLDRFDKLTTEEKLRLLIDRNLITRTELANADSLVALAMKFKNEDSGAVWNKVSALVGSLAVFFDNESEEEKMLKRYVCKLIDGKMAEIGVKTRTDDDENILKLRANLLGLAYYGEDRTRLRELAEQYDDDYKKMDNEVREDVLYAKVYNEPEMAEEFLKKYKTLADPEVKYEYLMAAISVRDDKYAHKMLELLGDAKTVKPQDQLHVFVALYRNPKIRMEALDWLTHNWSYVKETGGEKTLSDYPTVIGKMARTVGELEIFEKFFGPMENDLALSRAVKIGRNEIKARIKLIESDKQGVREAIRKELM